MNISFFTKVVQPLNLVFAGLSYLLGVGIADYLGLTLIITSLISGLVLIFCALVLSRLTYLFFIPNSLLVEFYQSVSDPNRVKRYFFYGIITTLMLSLIVYLLLRASDVINFEATLIMASFFLVALAYAVPPLRIEDKGFGELAQALMVSGFPLIFGFTLQSGSFHRLAIYISLPLVFLALAYYLIMDFPSFGVDQAHGRQSLLNRLTWQKAIPIHNILLVVSYGFILVSGAFGIPFRILWPALLTIPLAVYQTFMLRNIGMGLKPNWRILVINAAALLGFTFYLLTFTFWIS